MQEPDGSGSSNRRPADIRDFVARLLGSDVGAVERACRAAVPGWDVEAKRLAGGDLVVRFTRGHDTRDIWVAPDGAPHAFNPRPRHTWLSRPRTVRHRLLRPPIARRPVCARPRERRPRRST